MTEQLAHEVGHPGGPRCRARHEVLEPNTSPGDLGLLPWRLVPTESKACYKQEAGQALQTLLGQLRGPQYLHQFVSSGSSAGPAAWSGCGPAGHNCCQAADQHLKCQQDTAAEHHPGPSQSGHGITSPFTSQSQNELFRCYNFDPIFATGEYDILLPLPIPGLGVSKTAAGKPILGKADSGPECAFSFQLILMPVSGCSPAGGTICSGSWSPCRYS